MPKFSYKYRQLKKQANSVPGAPAPLMEKALKAVEKKRGLNENKAAALIRSRLAKGQSVKGVRRVPKMAPSTQGTPPIQTIRKAK